MAVQHKLFGPRRRRAGLCAVAGIAALAAAAPAVAAGAGSSDARDTLSDLAKAAAVDGRSVVQDEKPATPAVPGTRGTRALTAGATFYDAIGDNEGGLAPDLQRMVATTGDDGRYTVGVTLGTNYLYYGDFVAAFINTDGNSFTGSSTFGGADVALSLQGQGGPGVASLSRWNGFEFQPSYSPSLSSYRVGASDEVWSLSAAEIGVAPGTRTTLMFGASYSGYYDFAPEPGVPAFAFTAGSLTPPPPPPAPPAPAPVVSAPAHASTAPATTSPLAVRSFALSPRPGGVRISLGWAHGTGGVRWQVKLSGRVNGSRVTKTVRGVGASGTRMVAKSVSVAAPWRGTRISAQLAVSDDVRTIHRSRTILIPR